jgi:hypothetical protein
MLATTHAAGEGVVNAQRGLTVGAGEGNHFDFGF